MYQRFSRRSIARLAFGFTTALFAGASINVAFAEGETIKVGVLHSLSGTMAISETTLKDTVLMMIAQQNAKGGNSLLI